MQTLAAAQTERLDNVTKQIAALIEGIERQQQALRTAVDAKFQEIRTDATANATVLKDEVTVSLIRAADQLTESVKQLSQLQHDRLNQMSLTLSTLTTRAEEQQEKLRKMVEDRLDAVRTENAAKLEEMRQTVDEKLQNTLEQRLGSSFKLVSDQLEQVYKSVGEMQTLATGVGDLKKVLTNVKARGTWGEVSLGNLLDQFLTSDQFARNVEIRPGSNQRVEFAIRLPGSEGDGEIWLPLDAKFPQEDYDRLVDAADRADPEAVEAAVRGLELRIKAAAKDIHDKYVSPPHSTDFGVLFLPTEGLFAEVIRRADLVDALQRDCRVIIAGPTTLVALLNSLRMGFRTLAIQKRSSEVWRVLSAVKTEFNKYGDVLDKVQKKLLEASNQIDQVAVRRRAIDRKLLGVELLPEAEATTLLDVATELVAEEV
jgi:DNA recombination protein RmuC